MKKIKIGDKVYNNYHEKEFIVYKIIKELDIYYCKSSEGTTHTFGIKDLTKKDEVSYKTKMLELTNEAKITTIKKEIEIALGYDWEACEIAEHLLKISDCLEESIKNDEEIISLEDKEEYFNISKIGYKNLRELVE